MEQKPIHVWLYVILSMLPFVGLYPLLKLKKTRKMFLINLIAIGLGYGFSVLLLYLNVSLKQGALLPLYCAVFFLYVGCAIFVYGWANDYNKKLKSTL